jgi:hypothetical protein
VGPFLNKAVFNSDTQIMMEVFIMKTLKIEWKHLDVDGETCDRCYDTGENLNAEVNRLNRKLASKGIKVEWFETKLGDTQIPQSNVLLFDGVPIEEILEIQVSKNHCSSCTDLVGHDTYCRTVIYDGEEYEDIPAKAIRQAVYKVLNIEELKDVNDAKEASDADDASSNCACCSDCGDDLKVVEASGCSCGTGCCS